MDNVTIFSLQEHIVNLRKVFDKLNGASLKVQIHKSERLHTEVAFLSHIVTLGVKLNPDK